MLVPPREVPSAPRPFVNRQPDFERMESFWARSADSVRVGLCRGLPGVGKTAFVRRCVANVRAAGMFPDGDLHVEFGGAEGERISVADALAACLRALGVDPSMMPATLSERANRLRSLTAHLSVLIVLEDVTDPAQVLPFIPNGPASAVLVTTRHDLRELEVEGAEVLRIDPLDDVAGAHMIAELVGPRATRAPAAVAALARYCAGLPVALKVAAGQLRARPGLRVESVVAALADDDGGGFASFTAGGRDPVSSAFSVAYEELDEESALLYRLLGLYPGRDLTVETAAALVGRDPAAIAGALDALVGKSLLSEDDGQRLRMHELVRRHAARLARSVDSEAFRQAALRNAVQNLVRTASFADRAILGEGRFRCTPGSVVAGHGSPFDGADPRALGLDWLEAERLNLVAVQRLCVDNGWNDWAWQLAEALTALYLTRRYYVEWTQSSKVGADAARAAGNARAEARLRSFVSRAWLEVGDTERAHDELIARALPLAETAGDGRLLASVWEFVGRFRDATEPERAREAYQRSLDLFDREGDRRGRAFVSFFVARTYWREGDLAAAESTMRAALALIEEVGDPRMTGRAHTDLGRILMEKARIVESEAQFRAAVDVLSRDRDAFFEAEAQEQLALVAERTGDRSAARGALARLVELHRRLGSERVAELTDRMNALAELS